MSEPLDLKLLGRLLTEAGLVDKNFAAMSADEVRGVAGCMDLATKKRCIHCDQWEKLPDSPWWIGKCRIGEHDINRDAFCTLTTDEPPF